MATININFEEILNSIKAVLLASYTTNYPKVKEIAEGYVKDAETRLKNLAEGALSGELSYQFVVEKLKDEEINIKDQFLSLVEVGEAALVDLAAQAVSIFEAVLKAAIIKSKE